MPEPSLLGTACMGGEAISHYFNHVRHVSTAGFTMCLFSQYDARPSFRLIEIDLSSSSLGRIHTTHLSLGLGIFHHRAGYTIALACPKP